VISLSGPFDGSLPADVSDRFLELVSLTASRLFSLSAVLMNSPILPGLEVLSSRFSLTIAFSRLGSIEKMSSSDDGDSGSSGSISLVLGAGLGAGLLVLVLVVSGLIFWFATRGRAAPFDVSETGEFAMSPTDSRAPWDENVEMMSAENALASEGIIVDVPFPALNVMEEGLWLPEYIT
jgi:hypothetical protein